MIPLILFVFGLFVGSFLNVVVIRSHNKKEFLRSRSECMHCHKKLGPLELVPLLSFIFLGGKCKKCRKKISWQYPAVELLTGVVFLLIGLQGFSFQYFPNLGWFSYVSAEYGIGTDLWMYFLYARNIIFACFLILLFLYDFRYYLLPDKITIPGIILAFGINLLLGYSIISLLIGAMLGAGFFLIQFSVSSGKWVGGGDIRMGALMGAMLGWPATVMALFLSYVMGAIFGIALMMRGEKTLKSHLPFGTFLAVGTYIVMLYYHQIFQWYIGFFL